MEIHIEGGKSFMQGTEISDTGDEQQNEKYKKKVKLQSPSMSPKGPPRIQQLFLRRKNRATQATPQRPTGRQPLIVIDTQKNLGEGKRRRKRSLTVTQF